MTAQLAKGQAVVLGVLGPGDRSDPLTRAQEPPLRRKEDLLYLLFLLLIFLDPCLLLQSRLLLSPRLCTARRRHPLRVLQFPRFPKYKSFLRGRLRWRPWVVNVLHREASLR